MQTQKNVSLAKFTSFKCGGPAEELIECKDLAALQTVLSENHQSPTPLTILGYGTNVLISDRGMPGLTVVVRGGDCTVEGSNVVVDTGVWWDDLVNASIAKKLWGLELMSGIPSSVGAAVVGNIAAYGQQVSDRLLWIEVFNTQTGLNEKLFKNDIEFSYRQSSLQAQPHLIVLRAAFELSTTPTTELMYHSALKAAEDLKLAPDTLLNRQKIILEARARAGSLYNPKDENGSRTAGSFFKNPKVDIELAKKIASFDESGKSLERLLEQNKIHGGHIERVSAAHVLLAAGFKRGQTWGNVRLHPDHILKLENTGNATAQEVFNVAQTIIEAVESQLGITLEPEVKFLGQF